MICIMCKGTFIPQCKHCPECCSDISLGLLFTPVGGGDGSRQPQMWLLPPESTETLLESGPHQSLRYTQRWTYSWKIKNKKDFQDEFLTQSESRRRREQSQVTKEKIMKNPQFCYIYLYLTIAAIHVAFAVRLLLLCIYVQDSYRKR